MKNPLPYERSKTPGAGITSGAARAAASKSAALAAILLCLRDYRLSLHCPSPAFAGGRLPHYSGCYALPYGASPDVMTSAVTAPLELSSAECQDFEADVVAKFRRRIGGDASFS
ncbi:hypothetical protein KCP76_00200 [Salmonella enterica subsp. enterica serovar Weltevreden]|nr:hypothetical protein KCP76_00200 [Salmonella enterica subsp. enterica serovar Weltevreden]